MYSPVTLRVNFAGRGTGVAVFCLVTAELEVGTEGKLLLLATEAGHLTAFGLQNKEKVSAPWLS